MGTLFSLIRKSLTGRESDVRRPILRKRSFALRLEELERREVPAAGLVAAYSFDQGAGTVLTDLSGNNNNGTIKTATWSSTGKHGGALSFNGTSSLVTVPNSASLTLAAGMTLEAWVNSSNTSKTSDAIFKNGGGAQSYALFATNTGTNPDAPSGSIRIKNLNRSVASGANIAANQWVFLTATYDGSALRIYVNGVLQNTLVVTGTIKSGTGALTLGGDNLASRFFKGLIDDVRLYNRALSQAEIQTDMNTPVNSTAAPLVANAGGNGSTNEGATYSFSGSATGGIAPYTYAWNFGDGTTGTGAAASHLYVQNGTYTATLTVTDANGSTSQSSSAITVNNVAPSGLTLSSDNTAINENGTLNLSGSFTDPGTQDTITVLINWGDGNTSTVNLSAAQRSFSKAHQYLDNPSGQPTGSFNITVTVTDKDNASTQATTTIQVKNVAPTSSITSSISSANDKQVNFVSNVTDPGSLDTFTYAWNFGDGTTSTLSSPSHTYSAYGSYTVTLTVTDKDGAAGSASKSVTVQAASSTSTFPNNVNVPALPAPTGTVINVSTAAQLQTAVANLQSNQTIMIAAGTYNLTDTLWIAQNVTNVAIRGATGKVGDVVINGAGMSGSILFGFWAGNVQGLTIADLTLQGFADHGILLNTGVQSPLFHNLHIVDTGEQFIKSNPDGNGGGVNNGIVEYCTIEYSTFAPGTYTNGVDVHTGANWIIRNNVFRNIRAQGGLAGPAILVWNHSSGTVTQNNTFINNQIDIAYGLQELSSGTDHSGGIIANNFIYHPVGSGGDIAIMVNDSPNTQVFHNTVLMNGNYPNAIEYRFAETTGVIINNNLTDASIASRDGATATVSNNLTSAQSAWFVNATVGDLHLKSTATAAIDKVTAPSQVTSDYDGQTRTSGSLADYGADEYVASTGPDTTAPTVSLTGPSSGSFVKGTINVTANASDNVGVVGVQFYLDGVALSSQDTASPYSISWNTTTAGNGSHTLTAKASDAAGNSTTSTAISVTVDNSAPTISISNPTAAGSVSGTINVTATAGDNSGVAGVLFYLDGYALGSEDTTSPFSYSWNSTTASNGSHTLTAVARDAAGNTTTSSAVTVTVNNTVSQPASLVGAYGLSEGTGTTTADSSGSNNTGTLSSATWSASGKYGNALSFNGSNSYVDLGNASSLQLTGSMTISAWINSAAFPADDAAIVSKRGSGSNGFQLDTTIDKGPRTIGFKLTSSSGANMARYGSTAMLTSQWYYVTGVYNASTQSMDVYLNGVLDNGSLTGTVTSSQQNSTLNVDIGKRAGASGFNFNGLIDEVRIYNRALSQAEIQADMNAAINSVGSSSTTDTTAPAVGITSPSNSSTVSGTINIQATASDNVGVAGVQFYMDGSAVGTEDTSGPYTYSCDTTGFANGNHTLTAKARDAAGNLTTSAPVTVTVSNSSSTPDTTPPTVTSTSPANGSTGVGVVGNITVYVSEALDPATVTSSTVHIKNASGQVVSAGMTYYSANKAVVLSPNSNLNYSSNYTIEVIGGSSGVKDLAGNALASTYTATFTTGTAPAPSGQYIVTPYDKIPNFAANPTVVSISSGNWSSPSTWSTGVVPAANAIVSIAPGTAVTFDVAMSSTQAVTTIGIQSGGKLAFRTDINTTMYVSNLLVLQGGELDVGTEANPVAANVTASIIIANKPLDTTNDPGQWGNGLIGLGTVSLVGAVKTDTFIRLATEPKAGQTTLKLSKPATGWKVGDKLLLPDTRQLLEEETGSSFSSQVENLAISAISADGLTITLTTPLAYDHLGARSVSGSLDYLPHVANQTRNVVVRSESATGNRGYVYFTYRADIDIKYAQFSGLGRTKNVASDNTTFAANGSVTHVGANQEARNAVVFSHLIGPVAPQANGYQFTFIGNSVFCPISPMPFAWGINVTDSYYGIISKNILYNWAGAGLFVNNNSSYNVIVQNFAMQISGTGNRTDQFLQGDGYWFGNPNNYVTSNVATDINATAIYSYGFDVDVTSVGVVTVPAYQGADPSVSGQSRQIDMNGTPLLQFQGNEVYGATPNGMTAWWLGTYFETVKGNAGVIKDFVVWHHHKWGYFGYETNNLTIDGFIARGDATILPSHPY